MDDTLEKPGSTDTGRLRLLGTVEASRPRFWRAARTVRRVGPARDDAELLSDLYLHMAPGCH